MKLGIVGATGAVGNILLELLEAENAEIVCFTSQRSANKVIKTKTKTYQTLLFSSEEASKCAVIFLCVSGDFALEQAQKLAQKSYVIDASSAFRYHDDVPLLVPPINGSDYKGEKLIAGPNCTSAVVLMALAPIHRAYGIEHIIISSYQAASGAGVLGVDELRQRTTNFNDYDAEYKSDYFFHDLAYNVVPHIDSFLDNGYTREEMKVVWEVRKIMNLPQLPISVTAVRVPSIRSHAESVTLKLNQKIDRLEDVRQLISGTFGVDLVDDTANNRYPMPVTSTYKHNVEVGRLRQNLVYGEYGLDFFVSGDQLLRGAALNLYECYQLLIEKSLVAAA